MKKTPKKIITKTKTAPAKSASSKGIALRWLVFVCFFLGLLALVQEPTVRSIRLLFLGDPIEKISLDFKVDGVKAEWGYACWTGPFAAWLAKYGHIAEGPINQVKQNLPPKLDHNIADGPLNIEGTSFEHGIGSHAPSKVALDLGGRYKNFSCKVGLDKTSGDNHGVIFHFIADGKEIAVSPKLGSDAYAYPIDCSVEGVHELILYADNVLFDDTASNVDWVDLKFEPATNK